MCRDGPNYKIYQALSQYRRFQEKCGEYENQTLQVTTSH